MTAFLSDDQDVFNEQVAQDVRGFAHKDIHEALRQPNNLEAWIIALKVRKRSIESQLAAYKASVSELRVKFDGDVLGFLKERALLDRWRSDAIRFKNGVEDTLDEANALLRMQ